MDRQITTIFQVVDYKQLTETEKKLVEKAKIQTELSYAPYSQFCVGAAVLLENGDIVCGNNQENAAFPSGLCAERVAMFYANSQYPDVKPIAVAIAAKKSEGFLQQPITPCGSCRQVLLETENRYKTSIKTILFGTDEIYIINKISDFLPWAFSSL